MSAPTAMDVETGDEIRLPCGDVWSVVPSTCGGLPTGIHLVKGAFKDHRRGFGPMVDQDILCTKETKGLVTALLSAPGVELVKGVGLTKKAKRKRSPTVSQEGQG